MSSKVLSKSDTNNIQKIEERNRPPIFIVKNEEVGPKFEKWYLLLSDVHFDNPHCKRNLLKRHLDQALELNAGIIDNGDFFCAMQGKNDRRGHKEGIRKDNMVDCYFDSIVDSAHEFLKPYAHMFVMMGQGNHETAITKHNEINITRRLCEKVDCHYGGYHNVIVFQFGKRNDGLRTSFKMYMHHGYGGGGPVTKGVIQTNRRSASVDGMDAIFTGHIHEAWCLENTKMSVNNSPRVVLKTEYHVQAPTYKDEYSSGGFHIEKGRPPKPLGGWWLRFTFENQNLVANFIRTN